MKQRLALSLASLLASLAASEVALRILTPLPVTDSSNRPPDEALLYRLDRRMNDVDINGFRNPSVADSYDIVALGDSHTYGNNVDWDRTWPHVLGTRLRRRVYNMGVGSYGVYQHYYTFLLALEYRPSHIILGLYPANDLQGMTGCAILGLPWWQKIILRDSLETEPCTTLVGSDTARVRASPARQLYWWANERSALVNLFGGALSALSPGPVYVLRRGGYEVAVDRELVLVHERETSFDSELNRSAHRNSVRLFSKMVAVAAENGVHLGIMLIPSKERVLAKWSENGGGIVPEPIKAAVESEEILTRLYRHFFQGLGITVVDPTEAMARVVAHETATGHRAYPDHDGHPLESGYGVYAEVASALVN